MQRTGSMQQAPQPFCPCCFPLPLRAGDAEEGIRQPSGLVLHECNTRSCPFPLSPVTVQRWHTWPSGPCRRPWARAAEFVVTAAPSDSRITCSWLWAVGYAVSWEELCHTELNLSRAFRAFPEPYSCSHSVNGSSSVMEKEWDTSPLWAFCLLCHIRGQIYAAKVLVLYVYTYKYVLLKQLQEDSFPSKRGELSTQVLSFLLYHVSCYMHIFIYPD